VTRESVPQSDSAAETVILYRPVGQAELDLVAATGFTAFAARLSHQPIFDPVLTIQYAQQIAREWDTKDPMSGFVGYVTRFAVERTYLERFQIHQVGRREHLEYWIPADELDDFNRHIVGLIDVIEEYR
jgi:hypothetical protein